MKIVIAPDSYKNALRASAVAEAMRSGWQQSRPQDETVLLPMSDGGEGLCDALCAALNGTKVEVPSHDALMRERCALAVISGETAVVESAEANGIELLHRSELSPLKTTTFGVGEIIKTLIEKYHCRNFIIGIGGSATVDGGAGMLQALGYGMLDKNGEQVSFGARGLKELETITDENVIPELKECTFRIACDVTNPLCGELGCSAVFALQKGADSVMPPLS